MKKKIIRLEGVIGFVPNPTTVLQDVEWDDLRYWAQKPVAEIKYNYRPLKLELSETAKRVFANSIYYAKLLRL
jgi:hypothetical protein